jgi:hypothetical protein
MSQALKDMYQDMLETKEERAHMNSMEDAQHWKEMEHSVASSLPRDMAHKILKCGADKKCVLGGGEYDDDEVEVLRAARDRIALRRIGAISKRLDFSIDRAREEEKERVEKFIQSRKEIVDRLARRVAPRVRQIEKNRLQGKKAKK